MPVLRLLVVGLCLAVLLSACATKSSEPRGKVYCPACGAEFDALFEKRF